MPVCCCCCCCFAILMLGNQQLLLMPSSLFCNTLPLAFVAVLALWCCWSCHPQLTVAYYAIFTFLLFSLSLAALLLCICQCHCCFLLPPRLIAAYKHFYFNQLEHALHNISCCCHCAINLSVSLHVLACCYCCCWLIVACE